MKYINNKKSKLFGIITYDEKIDGLLCQTCMQAKLPKKRKNAFSDLKNGCKNFKKYAIERHILKSDDHKEAIAILGQKGKFEALMQNTNLKNIEKSIANSNPEYLNLIAILNWIHTEEISTMKIFSLVNLLKEKHFPLPAHHLSDTSIKKMTKSIAATIRTNLLEDLNSAKFIGLLIDESTDVSQKSELLLYLRYFSRKHKDVVERYFKIVQPHDCKAETIYHALKKNLEENLFEKIHFLCTDGAPAMASTEGGVPGWLKVDLPKLISFHCICHKENLALQQIYKKSEILSWFNKTLHEIIFFFDGSTRRNIFEEFQALLEGDFEKIYKLIKAKEIRWSSFFAATQRLKILYQSIVEALSDIKSNKIEFKTADRKEADRLFNQMISFDFLLILHWLCDFLAPLISLINKFQERTYLLSQLRENIQLAVDILEANYLTEREMQEENKKIDYSNISEEEHYIHSCQQMFNVFGGFNLEEFIRNCLFTLKGTLFVDDEIVIKYKLGDRIYELLPLSIIDCRNLKHMIISTTKEFLISLKKILPEVTQIAINFEIFNFEKIKNITNSKQLFSYGNQEISNLINYYYSDQFIKKFKVAKCLVLSEWDALKWKIAKNFVLGKEKEFLFDCYNDQSLHNIMPLLELFNTLPCSNAEVERGFSMMKRIKTNLRNRLSESSLDDLMLISTYGNSKEYFDEQKVFEMFIGKNKLYFL